MYWPKRRLRKEIFIYFFYLNPYKCLVLITVVNVTDWLISHANNHFINVVIVPVEKKTRVPTSSNEVRNLSSFMQFEKFSNRTTIRSRKYSVL